MGPCGVGALWTALVALGTPRQSYNTSSPLDYHFFYWFISVVLF